MVWGSGFFKGMKVTLANAFRGPVTIQYPEERMELPERARWAVAPVQDDEGSPRCTACMACVRECPDNVLALEVETREDKSKHIRRFTYEVGACMFCGLCVERCPFSALQMSHDYELATTDTSDLLRVLLEDVDAASPKRKKKAQDADSAEAAGSPARTAEDRDDGAGDEDENDGADKSDARDGGSGPQEGGGAGD